MKKPLFRICRQLFTAGAALLFHILPVSCKQNTDDPSNTSDGPIEIQYHQLVIECAETTTQHKGVAILDFRFDKYANGETGGYGSGKYLAFSTKNLNDIDGPIQAAQAAIAHQSAEVKTFPTLTDFLVNRLSKAQGYQSTKSLSAEAIWGILANEETTIAQLHGIRQSWDFGAMLTAILATPAQAQTVGKQNGGYVDYHSSYFYSPPPQPGALPEYKMNVPSTVSSMPANATPGQRSSRGETDAQRAAREEAARQAAQAGRTNRGPRDIGDIFNGIYDRLGDAFGRATGQGGSSGDPHLRMFDDGTYGFQAVGEFVATKGENLEVQARQEDVYRNGMTSANTGVAARIGNDQICFYLNPFTQTPPRLFINNQETALSAIGQVALTGGNQLRLAGSEKLVFSNAQGEGVIIFWNTPYLNYSIMLGDARKGKVMGLLGNYDGQYGNDVRLSGGTIIEPTYQNLHGAFADSWRVTNATSLFVYEAGKNTDSYSDKAFPRRFPAVAPDKRAWAESICTAAGVTRQPERSQCIFDVGMTGDTRMAQASVVSQHQFPASADMAVFRNLKIDLKEGQSNDAQTKNLLDLDNGTFYAFSKGASVAYDIDVVFDYYSGPWFAGPGAVKNCGVSCGAYTIWPHIVQQQWAFFPNTFLRYTTIPANQWDTFTDAAALRRAWTFEADEKTELVKSLVDLGTTVPLSQYLWSFQTQQGKNGLIRFTQAQHIKANGTASFTFDIKIER